MCEFLRFLQWRNSQCFQGVSVIYRPLGRQIFKTASLWPLRIPHEVIGVAKRRDSVRKQLRVVFPRAWPNRSETSLTSDECGYPRRWRDIPLQPFWIVIYYLIIIPALKIRFQNRINCWNRWIKRIARNIIIIVTERCAHIYYHIFGWLSIQKNNFCKKSWQLGYRVL